MFENSVEAIFLGLSIIVTFVFGVRSVFLHKNLNGWRAYVYAFVIFGPWFIFGMLSSSRRGFRSHIVVGILTLLAAGAVGKGVGIAIKWLRNKCRA
jgi:hypothetical protein